MTALAAKVLVEPARWPRGRWLALALAGLGILAVCSVVVADHTVSQPERGLFLWVSALPGWLEGPLWIFQQAGNIIVATLATAAVGLVLRNRGLVLAAPVAAVSKLVLERILKLLVERPRPGTSIGGEAILRGHVPVDGLSFVSGHATITTAMAVLLTATLHGRWKAVPWVFVILNGFGRVHAGAHNPLDIVGGVGLGLAIGATIVAPLLSGSSLGRGRPEDGRALPPTSGFGST